MKLASVTFCLLLAGATANQPRADTATPSSSAYVLPSNHKELRQLSDCSDFIAVGVLDRVLEPFNRLGGGGSAVQVAIYRHAGMIKGTLNSQVIPIHHLTDDSPYAQGDRKSGFELDRKVFVPGLKVLLFLRGRCRTPEDNRGLKELSFDEALRWGALKLTRGYEMRFYTLSSIRGVYLWTQDAEERIKTAIREIPSQGRPNSCCPHSRPSEFGPPCPREVLEGK